jgi:hypothetical protein
MHFDISTTNHTEVVDRLTRFVADAEAFDEGAAWYDMAHTAARALANDVGCSVRQAAGVIAALSPQLDAEINLTGVLAILDGTSRMAITGRQLDKALRCVRGDPTEILDPITGPKTWNFFWNIYAPGLRDHVTVDGRYADVVANVMRPWKAKRGIDRGGYGSRYDRLVCVTEDVASQLRRCGHVSMTAPRVQAIAWCEAKRIELAYPHCKGKVRKQGPSRKGQPYV